MEVILYSKECNWYTRCCLEAYAIRETILYSYYGQIRNVFMCMYMYM